MKTKNLFLYTVGFPSGATEPYLKNEVPTLSKYFHKVVIITSSKKHTDLALPENVSVLPVDDVSKMSSKRKLLFANISLVVKIMIDEYKACSNKRYFLSQFRLVLSQVLHALSLVERIRLLLSKQDRPVIHYSFWMNEFALALAILKQKDSATKYVFRVHGFDLYEERRIHKFMPFRTLSYRNSERFFAVSKLGLDYVKKRYTHTDAADYSYLGTLEWGTNPFDPANFTIATCSVIRPLKRVHLVAEALRHIDFPVTWYHLGGGNPETIDHIQAIVKELPKHITVVFKGQVTQSQLFDFYNTVPVSVLLNMSDTEGLPVAVMEATSLGIPVMATDVGGTSEIANESTGWLLSKDITPELLAKKIEEFKDSPLNTETFRRNTKAFWKANFFAEKNYADFCETLLKL